MLDSEYVRQRCLPSLRVGHPQPRAVHAVGNHGLPPYLTRFVGRQAELRQLRESLAENRLTTLTGAGGVGKTRLAVQVAAEMIDEFADGVWYVDLAHITGPELVPGAVVRALGLADQPGRSTMDTLIRFVADRRLLLVIDTCEHLLDASAALAVALLGAAPGLVVLATSREPTGVPGEMSWRVPSLSLAGEAIELFADRARSSSPNFTVSEKNSAEVSEICARLDGLPLAIELAAARLRGSSLAEILDGLHDRFRLLTGGARTTAQRQQTLRASVDWSHALLTPTEQTLFRRIAVFLGGFDLDAAQAVAARTEVERYQVLDELIQLVDKSLVVADVGCGPTRYRLLETVREYAAERLAESGEADAVRSLHCDYYTALAAALDTPRGLGHEQYLERIEIEMDNLRTAFGWSREKGDVEQALALACSLRPLWFTRGRIGEGRAWFDTVLAEWVPGQLEPAEAVRARALADKAVLDGWVMGGTESLHQAEHALAIARKVDDPALLTRALTACGLCAAQSRNAEMARERLTEAIDLAGEIADRWSLSRILAAQVHSAAAAGDPLAVRAAALEGHQLADEIGDVFNSRECRTWLGCAQIMQGDLSEAVALLGAVAAEAESAGDEIWRVLSLGGQSLAQAYQGDTIAARATAEAILAGGAELGGRFAVLGQVALGFVALAAGDVAAMRESRAGAWQEEIISTGVAAALRRTWSAEAALADGDLAAARDCADEAVATATGWWLVLGRTARVRVAIAKGEAEPAERDIHEALALGTQIGAHLGIPDILECLADLRYGAGSFRDAARLCGAAHGIRKRMGAVRFKIWEAGYEASLTALRKRLGKKEFDRAWAEGDALSVHEAVAYAQRGRGGRKRPATGWAALTPTEHNVVRLVSEGLANKHIAARLFVSPRTVQTHLTHIYTKLGLSSRVQLVQEAARHS
jgi:predicted ATPase/DNA-binding CsgD family transcriptional regulator